MTQTAHQAPNIHIHFVSPQLRPSPTMSAGEAAEPARVAGRPLLTFTIGDIFEKPTDEELSRWKSELAQAATNASTPEEKARTAIHKNLNAYAGKLGTDGFRAAAAYKFQEETGLKVEAKNVAVGTGAKGVLNAIGSYFQPGDEVIVASSGWPTNVDVFTHGVKILEVDTNGRGLISPEALGAMLKQHPRAKAILINSPNNPTGAAYGPEEREAIMQVIWDKAPVGVTVILDNPYGKINYESKPGKRTATEEKLFNGGRIVEVRSMSKEYGLAGKRVGYMVTQNDKMIRQMGIWNENRGGLDSERQNEAQAALLFGDQYVERNVQDLRIKRDAMQKGIDALQYATMQSPSGAIYAWVDFAKLKGKVVPAEKTLDGKAGFVIEKPSDVQRYLIEAANIVAVPGTPFCAPGSPAGANDWHFRLCFSGSKKDIEKAMTNLAEAEKSLTDPRRFAGDSNQALAAN